MKLLHALLPACALLLPCVLSAESSFEGKVSTMQITSSTMDKIQSFNYSLKNGLVRIDVNAGKAGPAGMIMDMKNHQMIILMAQQHMYMVDHGATPDNPAAGDSPPAAAPTRAARSAADGQFHRHGDQGGYPGLLLHEAPRPRRAQRGTTDIWVDRPGSATFAGLMQGGVRRPQRPRRPQGMGENALKGVGISSPMRVVNTSEKDGKRKFKLEVTSENSTRRAFPDSLFSQYPRWLAASSTSGAMMEQVLPGGFGGGRRPTDGSNWRWVPNSSASYRTSTTQTAGAECAP